MTKGITIERSILGLTTEKLLHLLFPERKVREQFEDWEREDVMKAIAGNPKLIHDNLQTIDPNCPQLEVLRRIID